MKKIITLILVFNLILLLPVCAAESTTRKSEVIFYEDFSSFSEGIQTQTQVTNSYYKPYNFVEGQYEVKSENGNKFLRLRSPDGNTGYPLWRISLPASKFTGARTLIVEYRVRNKTYKTWKSFVRSRTGSTYGTFLPGFVEGNIKASANSGTTVGKYKEDEWVTLTNVLHVLPTSSTSGKVYRRVYVNGKYFSTTIQDNVSSGSNDFVNHAGALNFNFNLVRVQKSPAEYFDIDYVSVYTEGDTVGLTFDGVSADSESIILNSETPIRDSYFKSRVKIYDTEGNLVTTLSDTSLLTGENCGKGMKFKLTFANKLKPDTDYVMKMTSIYDIFTKFTGALEFPFHTRPADFVYNDMVISKSEKDGKTYAQVKFTADNNTSFDDEFILIWGGYKEEDGAYKMVNGEELAFKFPGNTKENSYFTDELEVTGSTVIQCTLWHNGRLISVSAD